MVVEDVRRKIGCCCQSYDSSWFKYLRCSDTSIVEGLLCWLHQLKFPISPILHSCFARQRAVSTPNGPTVQRKAGHVNLFNFRRDRSNLEATPHLVSTCREECIYIAVPSDACGLMKLKCNLRPTYSSLNHLAPKTSR